MFQKQGLTPDVVSTTIPNPGMEREEPSKKFQPLSPFGPRPRKQLIQKREDDAVSSSLAIGLYDFPSAISQGS
jgi:hypothetical protein